MSLFNEVDCIWLTLLCTARVLSKLCDQCVIARNAKPPWSAKAIVPNVHNIERHDVVSSGISADEFRDKCPQEWTKQTFEIFGKSTESYTIEVIAAYHFKKQELMSCRLLTGQLVWRGRVVEYS